jgi:hypothetical protein
MRNDLHAHSRPGAEQGPHLRLVPDEQPFTPDEKAWFSRGDNPPEGEEAEADFFQRGDEMNGEPDVTEHHETGEGRKLAA